MSKRFDGDVVIITGGASGIGLATGRRLAEQGARVVLVDLAFPDSNVVSDFASSASGQPHLQIEADVTSSESLERAVARVLSTCGRIDIVVANAGIAVAGTVATSSVDDLTRIVDVNLNGVIRTVHATLPAITEQRGYYLLVSSAAALKSIPGQSAYAASKVGVEAFGAALRLEVAHKGVDVGVAHPAFVRTPMFEKEYAIAEVRDGIHQLPWPFDVITALEDCVDLFVDALGRRRRKVYVPRALQGVDTVRGVFTGRVWEMIVKHKAATTVPALEIRKVESAKDGSKRAGPG